MTAATPTVTTSGHGSGGCIEGRPPGPLARALLAEHDRDLLQHNDNGDTGGETLDHRRREIADGATESGGTRDDQDEAALDTDHQHPTGPELMDYRNQHDGHGTGRSGNLEIRTTEHRGDRTGNDGRDQAGGGTQSRRDTERQC